MESLIYEPPIMASVIVLTHNHSQYIAQALDSVLMQETSFQYEILVSDDASTDGTGEIVKRYQQMFPQMIRSFIRQSNLGASRNAYETMKCARGRYLASCEGDDYWTDRKKLQIQVDFLENEHRFSGCVHPVRLVNESGVPLRRQRLDWISNKAEFSLDDFHGIRLPGHGVSMVRRNYFLQEDFDADIIYQADRNIADRSNMLLWLSKGNFYSINRSMACYRQISNGKNLTSALYKNNSESLKNDFQYTKRLEKYANEVLNVNAGFQYHKRDLFVRALVSLCLHPSKEKWHLVKSIFHDADEPWWYIKGVFPVLARKIYRKMF